jgi:hypothetical protein
MSGFAQPSRQEDGLYGGKATSKISCTKHALLSVLDARYAADTRRFGRTKSRRNNTIEVRECMGRQR